MKTINSIYKLSSIFLKLARSHDVAVREAETKKQQVARIAKILEFGKGDLYNTVLKTAVNSYKAEGESLLIEDRLNYIASEVKLYNKSIPQLVEKGYKWEELNYIFSFFDRSKFEISKEFRRLNGILTYTSRDNMKSFFAQLSASKDRVKQLLPEAFKAIDYISQNDRTDDGGLYVDTKLSDLNKEIESLFLSIDHILSYATNPEVVYESLKSQKRLWYIDYSRGSKGSGILLGTGKLKEYNVYLLNKGCDSEFVNNMSSYLDEHTLTTGQLNKIVELYRLDKTKEEDYEKVIQFISYNRGDVTLSRTSIGTLDTYLNSHIGNYSEFSLFHGDFNKNFKKHLFNLIKEYSLKLPETLIKLFKFYCRQVPKVKESIGDVDNKGEVLNKDGVKKLLFNFCKAYESYNISGEIELDTIEFLIRNILESGVDVSPHVFMKIVKNYQLIINQTHHYPGSDTYSFIAHNDFYKNNWSFQQYLIYSKLEHVSDEDFLQPIHLEGDQLEHHLLPLLNNNNELMLAAYRSILQVRKGGKSKLIPNSQEAYVELSRSLVSNEFAKIGNDLEVKEKAPELFNLNVRGDKYTFKSLETGDKYALMIGADTDCCQMLGQAGQNAAIDAYINNLAGTLVLYDTNNNILAQSYFHYIPEDNGYILDNVEINSDNVKNSGVNLVRAYSELAAYMKDKFKVSYFRCGLGYNKLPEKAFAEGSDRNDNRHFEHHKQYSDYDKTRFLDLLSPVSVKPSGNLQPLK